MLWQQLENISSTLQFQHLGQKGETKENKSQVQLEGMGLLSM